MTTAKDLFIIALDLGSKHSVGQGDLSLALAGAELVDLIGAGAVVLDGDRIVPAEQGRPDDHLLAEAFAALTGQTPHEEREQVEDWLWRRGRDLAASYRNALEDAGELTREHRGRLSFGTDRLELADTPSRRRAVNRWEAEEPVLAALAVAVGIPGEQSDEEPAPDDEAVTTVLAAVNDAVMELEAVRQRRSIESSAFANVWRAP
ncbi:GPP34 family phosphoprotein [Streptomyces sp. NPDC086010]|uniref:GOLPH3/VPS74 family protein n=1 Tax=Streptomyces sp. NPDC086010 TaxID=3365745 RepID=UPI0037CF8EB9